MDARTAQVCLTGRGLTVDAVERLSTGDVEVTTTPEALDGVEGAAAMAEELAAARSVYGRTTGVGANRSVVVPPDRLDGHSLRILRSHAGGAGRLLSVEETRGAVAIRANQLLGGGSGASRGLVEALVRSINLGAVPVMHEQGGAGTGDMTAMAELGLALVGEKPWRVGTCPPVALARGDGLVVIESNAATLSVSCLALRAADRLLQSASLVAATTFVALRGNREACAEPVHAARPHPGAVEVAGRLRELVGAPGAGPARLQDPFALRCVPQVHGTAVHAAQDLRATIEIDLNATSENPLFLPSTGEVFHHGGFHGAPLAVALDRLRLAVLPVAQMAASRLAALNEPGLTGLRPFLAGADDGSSGTLILEYTAASALAAVRTAVTPAVTGHAVLSRGLEEHASFASAGALQLRALVDDFRTVLACELVAAVRALRQRPDRLDGVSPELASFAATASAALPADLEDRPLDGDVVIARDLVGGPSA